MNLSRKTAFIILSGLLLMLLGMAGCSDQNSLGVANSDSITDKSYSPPDGQVGFDGIVESIDQNLRMLTFVGSDLIAIAADDCTIVEIVNGEQTPLEFSDIEIGDEVRVCGITQEDGSILAHMIRIFGDSICPDYDVAFRDTIATIDYAAGTFTVKNRVEVISIDANTVIWGVIGGYNQNIAMKVTNGGYGHGNLYRHQNYNKVFLTFTDLAVGDVVEVRAYIETSETLLAGSIKLANCNANHTCVTFEANLASIDVVSNMVTFDGLAWIGTVCPNAVLLNSAGESMTLADFVIGDNVAVKGFAGEADSLKICEMILTGN